MKEKDSGVDPQVEFLAEELCRYLSEKKAHLCAEVAVELGYRRPRTSYWLIDESFEAKVKDRFSCAVCGRWQIVKKQNAAVLLYSMKYCPGCGSMMEYEDPMFNDMKEREERNDQH